MNSSILSDVTVAHWRGLCTLGQLRFPFTSVSLGPFGSFGTSRILFCGALLRALRILLFGFTLSFRITGSDLWYCCSPYSLSYSSDVPVRRRGYL